MIEAHELDRVGDHVEVLYRNPDHPEAEFPEPFHFTGTLLCVTDEATEGRYAIILQSESEIDEHEDGLRAIPLTWIEEVR